MSEAESLQNDVVAAAKALDAVAAAGVQLVFKLIKIVAHHSSFR